MNTRLVKWLGMPPVVAEDGWSVPDWKYENRRFMPVPGFTQRIVNQSDIPGLSRSYFWEKDLPYFLLEVLEPDALLICSQFPNEFRDVTGNPFPEHVQHHPYVLMRGPDGKPRLVKNAEIITRTLASTTH